jgi:hypothetical protein
MKIQFATLVTALALCTLGAVACSASPDNADLDEPAASSDNALGAAGATDDKTPDKTPVGSAPSSPGGDYLDFVGAWQAEGTAAPVHTIVFESTSQGAGHHFFAEPNAGPSLSTAKQVRPEGMYLVSGSTLTLAAKVGTPDVSGSYFYAFDGKDKDELVLSATDSKRVAVIYKRVDSYCDVPADCTAQGINVLACAGGGFSCAKHECAFHCGAPASAKE